MVNIQYATAENRRGKKTTRRRNHSGKIECPHLLRRAVIRKKETTTAEYNGLPTERP